MQGHTAAIDGLAFSPDSKLLASGGVDATVRLWDLATRRNLWTVQSYSDPVYSLTFSPDGQRVISGHKGTIRLWDVQTGQSAYTFEAHGHSIYSVAFSPDRRTLLSASADGTVKLWPASPAR